MNNLFEIKVCGINDEISMETALKCKVDYVGLVFLRKFTKKYLNKSV